MALQMYDEVDLLSDDFVADGAGEERLFFVFFRFVGEEFGFVSECFLAFCADMGSVLFFVFLQLEVRVELEGTP